MVLTFAIKKNVKSLFQMFALHLFKFIERNKEHKYDCCRQLSCVMGRRGALFDLCGPHRLTGCSVSLKQKCIRYWS
jgi:hypothetical protein